MVRFPREGSPLALALAEAGRSPLIDGPVPARPWLRLGGFCALSALLIIGLMIVIALLTVAIPPLDDWLRVSDALPDTPDRLYAETGYALGLGLVLGSLGAAILFGAAVTYRRPLTDFLWPGRRFDVNQFALGVVLMATLLAIAIPFYLLTGDVWDPPLLDPLYRDESRLVYVVGVSAGLLAAAAAEEVVCRGVLLRIMSAATRRPIVLCIVNGVVFSALHFDPDPVAFVARTLSGAVWTWTALRLGGLEFAIGAHLANNLMIALFAAPLSEDTIGQDSPWFLLIPEVATAAATVVFVERLARRGAVALKSGAPA